MNAVLVVDNLKAKDWQEGSAPAKTTVLVAHDHDNIQGRIEHHQRRDVMKIKTGQKWKTVYLQLMLYQTMTLNQAIRRQIEMILLCVL